jgi:hypothetical protein
VLFVHLFTIIFVILVVFAISCAIVVGEYGAIRPSYNFFLAPSLLPQMAGTHRSCGANEHCRVLPSIKVPCQKNSPGSELEHA